MSDLEVISFRPEWEQYAWTFGGNMDTPEMRAGVTCYLGVNVPGALLVTQAVESPLANVCDTNYTSIAKRYLAPGPAMDGAHARLRELAAVYQS